MAFESKLKRGSSKSSLGSEIKKHSYSEIFQRNIGLFTEHEQDILRNSCVAIAGAGGDGGLIAEAIARAGVGHIKVADPDTFEVSNLNRQNGSSVETIGHNKAQVIADIIMGINPHCKIELYLEGVTENNVSTFVRNANIVIDETEFTRHEIAVLLARAARQESIPIVSGLNVAFGAIVFACTPQSLPFERYLGFTEMTPIHEIEDGEVPIYKWCPNVPPYVDKNVFKEVAAANQEVPGISSAVALVAGVVSTEVVMYLTRNRRLVVLPRYIHIDAMTRKIKIRRSNRFKFYMSLLRLKFAIY